MLLAQRWLQYMTYICRAEECWSLSNVGYGLRTRQVILAHKPLLFTVIFSCTAFSTTGGSFRVGECVALIDAAIESESCYILQGEPWSIRWESGQGYITGIPVNPQHFTAQDPSLCFSLPDRCQSHCFSEPAFQRENPILLATSVTSGPPSTPVIQSHISSFQECTSVTLSYSPSLFSPDRGALGSLGAVCVWLSQNYSSSLVKRDTVTSSVSGGLHLRLLSAKCQGSRTCEGGGGRGLWVQLDGWSGDNPRTWAGQAPQRDDTGSVNGPQECSAVSWW